MSWNTRTDLDDKFRSTLVDRAKKRTGTVLEVGAKWRIDGDPKLSDTYPSYDVDREDTGRFRCACHGDFESFVRRMCSHVLWAMLQMRGVVTARERDVGVGSSPVGSAGVHLRSTADPEPAVVLQPLPEPPPRRPSLSLPATMEFGDLASYGDSPSLPGWVSELRPHQVDAVEQIIGHFKWGKRVVFLDAPTGSGKTLIGELVRRALSTKAIYTCTTKTLQEQIVRDFDYAKVIKGRSNYPTADSPRAYPNLTAESCHTSLGSGIMCSKCPEGAVGWTEERRHCDQCHEVDDCPYNKAKEEAAFADLAVLNTSYLLAEGNGFRSRFSGAPLAIIDEADQLEEELMGHIEVMLSERTLKELGIGQPEKKTVSDSWVVWVETEAIPAVNVFLDRMGPARRLDATGRKKKMRYERLQYRLKMLIKPRPVREDDEVTETVPDLAQGWVYQDYERGNVVFKPVRVDEYAEQTLWHLAQRWLLMSATIISSEQMAKDLGLADDEWALVRIGSTFDKERRPVYVEPVANMTFKEKDKEWPKVIKRILQLTDHHSDERILIHTVSYALAGAVNEALRTPPHSPARVFTYTRAREREQALADFLSHPAGIMVAPSFERGVDLHMDDCRVVIVAKVPYPNLRDKQINARLHTTGGQGWYSMNTVRPLVQMTGRAMRSAEDSCEIYLLDAQFMRNVWRKSRHLLPPWWTEALVMGGSTIPR